ncbi:MAG TPA: 5-(carboxyamino)imidazole ribonucleotide mutase [Candidatus Cloacimonetes bacterium]|nr:5-(carboxyamino)imidazole ribonucleotide mutase [Candidatus Cloacimonadota bacterium]HEX37829.1 5-(carboxyamino)imidazole ribonucleotide mutase [Candidatus Cloacimonadota bacterium]
MEKRIMVRIIAGSKTDMQYVEQTQQVLEDFGVPYDMHISSAHRNPERTEKLAKEAEESGVQVIIALAGMAAALPGIIAAMVTIPVIGVPLPGSALNGIDSLYSIVQMPTGIPVAGVGIGNSGAKNAAYLAVSILSLNNEEYKEKIKKYRSSWNN